MMIHFQEVEQVYQPKTPHEFVALKNVTTQFDEGKYYAIIGHTGSGKSTLIQHINGLLKPTKGSVDVNGTRITAKTKDKALRDIRKHVGMVFQFPESQLFEDNVEREIRFGPQNFKMDQEEVLKRAKALFKEFGFQEDIMARSPFQMSGGQMRKIALTSILAMDPNVIILDEPTAGLDPHSKLQVMQLIKRLQKEEGKTIILISHEMNDVAQYADEVKVMRQGQVVETLTPRELFSDATRVESLHLELPDIVQLQREVEQRHQMKFERTALTEEEFVAMYKEWQHER
ncbi:MULTISPECIES: energy-coupling factor transporter ATPase [Staphylococcus]|uniref:Energy-coupling factor transporter ATP-binding protein EcfA2 n=2 Tax=Staphylococcus TaxID=1279 RepID=A0A1Z3U068_9STAP|nr:MULTISPECIES: energy-coupling factor transporter ATPase [Staphylococcus]ASE36657.1 energy-coupling factor transporter ATPase [Staphylococcus pettenkoferi]EHM71672.1 cobalt ATP-binding cassette C-terminal domain protein [Staphylococcus pettenkoferi VCU012]MBX8994036.1 energy-coupling factor transporter ATPase [Staphylococcus pettenkoferi]MCI2791917.1 energy-coupling factor transporter ATPase [Staphylococcus pettenkoferi]MCY1567952.1 energy-coupling factor transporter ATPase [Staphylococcus p